MSQAREPCGGGFVDLAGNAEIRHAWTLSATKLWPTPPTEPGPTPGAKSTPAPGFGKLADRSSIPFL